MMRPMSTLDQTLVALDRNVARIAKALGMSTSDLCKGVEA